MTPEGRNPHQWYRGVPCSAKWPTIIGLVALLAWAGVFGIWAAVAPLDGAVMAPGTFVATGQNKLVQHLEGGIVGEILVQEGDLVEAGQTLLRIDGTLAEVKLRRLVLKKHRLLAIRARLDAEVSGQHDLVMPATFAANASDPELKAIMDRQRSELRAQRASITAEELVLKKEIAGIEESLQGYRAQVLATEQRIAMFVEELTDKTKLFKSHLTPKSEVLALQRTEAALVGDLGELVGRMADAEQRIARAQQRIVYIQSLALKTALKELREVETELDDVDEQIQGAQDVVTRTRVRAPARGIVVALNYHTSGAVVAPGAPILELLPVQDELIIEAQVKPSDVVHVKVGQRALVRLSALNQRITPTVPGNVVYLSADTLGEQERLNSAVRAGTRQAFYVVRVQLDTHEAHRGLDGFRPTPGMPADVYINTGERTFFQYIMRPVLDSFSQSFRES